MLVASATSDPSVSTESDAAVICARTKFFWGNGDFPQKNTLAVRMLLLDLDHTLVHCTRVHHPGHACFPITVRGRQYVVHLRRGVGRLLHKLTHHGGKGVPWGIWTAGTRDYMCAVLEGLFGRVGFARPWCEVVSLALCRDDCAHVGDGAPRSYYIKNLWRVGGGHVTLIDDDARHARHQFITPRRRIVCVPPFYATRPPDDLDPFYRTVASEWDRLCRVLRVNDERDWYRGGACGQRGAHRLRGPRGRSPPEGVC